MPLTLNANKVRVRGGMLYFLHKSMHNSSAVKLFEHEIILGVRSVTTDTFTVSTDAIVYFVDLNHKKSGDANSDNTYSTPKS